MQLAVLCLQAIAIHANLRFIDTIPIPLKESGQQRDTKLFGDGDQGLRTLPRGDRFGNSQQFLARQVLGKRISTNRAFVKSHYIRSLYRRFPAHLPDDRKIIHFIVIPCLELHGGDFQWFHDILI